MGISTDREIRIMGARMEARKASINYGDLIDRNWHGLRLRNARHMPFSGKTPETHSVSISEAKRIALKNKARAQLKAEHGGYFFDRKATVIGPKRQG